MCVCEHVFSEKKLYMYISIYIYIYIYIHIDRKYQEKILCDNIWA